MAVDITINETIDVVDITVNPNIIEVNVTRTSGGGGGSQNLQQVTDEGNTTDNDIIVRHSTDNEILISSITNSSQISVNQGTASISIASQENAGVTEALIQMTSDKGYNIITEGAIQLMNSVNNNSIDLNDNGLAMSTLGVNQRINLSNGVDDVSIKTDLITEAGLEQQLPDKSGTFAMLDDVPTTTSQLTNDGADGVNPFITALDIPTTGQASTLVREVKNMTGATLTKGTVVYISGANGNKALVSKAIATTDALSARTFGLLQSDILNNGLGNCVIIGDLSGINTSSFAEGAQLYLSGVTAGAFTDTRTLAPTHLVYVGKVTRSHPTQGQIEVQIQNGYELAEIHDVQIVTPLNNQALVYETSSQLWKNKTIIEDSITNGVTTVAPSQNAVFDALALKTNNTDWIDYSNISTIVGFSSFTIKLIFYKIIDNIMFVNFSLQGTSNSTALTFTLPNTVINGLVAVSTYVVNNGNALNTSGRIIVSGTNVTLTTNGTGVGFLASGAKASIGQFFIQI